MNDFFENSTILVTGATGFIGKLLICKLLGTFPGIRKIYIIVRSKKNGTAESRIEDYFNRPVFSILLAKFPEVKEKVQGIVGDICIPGLGLTLEDTNILKSEVQIVFHAAAAVRLNDSLISLISVNLQGTQNILELYKEAKQLKAFVHISSVYSHLNLEKVEEKVQDHVINYKCILKLVEILDPDTLSNITPTLKGKWPNTYTFTKYLTEQMVSDSNLPIGIFRPGIIISTYEDPIPGWIDNTYGACGVTAGAISGLIRCVRADNSVESNVVPADWCANAIIVAAKDIYERRKAVGHQDIPVYNYTSSDNPISWGSFNSMQRLGLHSPLATAAWYFTLRGYSSDISYKIAVFFLHFLPAYIMDGMLMAVGKKPRLMVTYNKIHAFLELLPPIATKQQEFLNDNVHRLWNNLDKHEQDQLPFHMPNLCWEKYFITYIPGIVKYLMDQKDEALPAARRRYMWLYVIHQSLKMIIFALAAFIFWYMICFVCKLFT